MDESWIERYFEGNLSSEEEQAFLQRMEEDPLLRKEWEYQQALKEAIHRKERADMKDFLRAVEARRSLQKVKKWAGVAASLVLVSGLWFYLLRDNSRQLAAEYFHPLPNMVSPVIRSTDAVAEEGAAFQAYEDGNYTEALRAFERGGKKPYVILYRGISYLALDSSDAALSTLNSFSATDNDLPLESYRLWYLGIAFLKKGEKQEARKIFTKLGAYDNPVREKAERLSEELR